jgi:hypothetical protein
VTDGEAWWEFPQHRRWFDKLDLALRFGYRAGPCGTTPSRDGWCCVRPIYNLDGMGVGARRVFVRAGVDGQVEPGFFWCEWFDGEHVSSTYEWCDGRWVPVSVWLAQRDGDELWRVARWIRIADAIVLPREFSVLADVGVINVEFVDGHVIEVHLRGSPDPCDADELIPVWADRPDAGDGVFVESFDDAGGFLQVPRLGFRVR